jgi:hypothetical protein
MENLEAVILVGGGLGLAFAFGWTATCKLVIPMMARAAKRTDAMVRLACMSHASGPLPAATTAGEPAGPDIGPPGDDRRKTDLRTGSAVVIDLHAWKQSAAASGAPVGSARSRKLSDKKTLAEVRRI